VREAKRSCCEPRRRHQRCITTKVATRCKPKRQLELLHHEPIILKPHTPGRRPPSSDQASAKSSRHGTNATTDSGHSVWGPRLIHRLTLLCQGLRYLKPVREHRFRPTVTEVTTATSIPTQDLWHPWLLCTSLPTRTKRTSFAAARKHTTNQPPPPHIQGGIPNATPPGREKTPKALPSHFHKG
jgi:hypothetical protein